MKTRYKILLSNIILTGLYCVLALLILSKGKLIEDGVLGFFDFISKTIALLLYYNGIHILWLFLIVYGSLKKNKEFVIGGIFSVGLSLLMFLFSILHFQT